MYASDQLLLRPAMNLVGRRGGRVGRRGGPRVHQAPHRQADGRQAQRRCQGRCRQGGHLNGRRLICCPDTRAQLLSVRHEQGYGLLGLGLRRACPRMFSVLSSSPNEHWGSSTWGHPARQMPGDELCDTCKGRWLLNHLVPVMYTADGRPRAVSTDLRASMCKLAVWP